jgi:xylulokinase
MTSGPLTLGIDLGTQSTKVLVYDPVEHRTLSVTSAPHDLFQRPDGTSEQDPAWWLEALESCLLATEPDLRKRVAAIGVSGQQHGFVPLDAGGEVLRPAKLWNDTSTVEECEIITRAFGGREQLIAEVGNPVVPGYTAPKVLWLKRHEPANYARLAKILLPHDFLNFYLTGNCSMEAGDASGTGWFDVRRRVWSKAVLEAIDSERDLRTCLPPLIEADACAGTLRRDLSERFGFASNVRISSGGGDNMMAAIGTGCVTPGTFTVSLGTSGTLFAYSDTPVVDPDGLVAAFCSSTGGYLPLVCTMNCTVSTELVRKLLEVRIDELDVLAAQVAPGSDGLVTLPFYSGERTPSLPNARGCLLGMTSQNLSPAHLVRSAMEGALFALKFGQEAFAKLGATPTQIRLTGGGAESAVWRTLAANVFGCSVVKPNVKETAAFGAALQALWMLEVSQGKSTSMATVAGAHVPEEGAAVDLDPTAQAALEAAYRNYLGYVELLKPNFR